MAGMGCVGCVRRFSPQLSLSFVDTCAFRFGNDNHRNRYPLSGFGNNNHRNRYPLSTFFCGVIVPKLFEIRYPTLDRIQYESTWNQMKPTETNQTKRKMKRRKKKGKALLVTAVHNIRMNMPAYICRHWRHPVRKEGEGVRAAPL